jgi:hypothetical protein
MASAYDPWREANLALPRLIHSTSVHLFGIGLGHLPHVLLNTLSAIENIYKAVKSAGATGGKISGAGGGGFMIFYCPKNTKYKVIETLETLGGTIRNFSFTHDGLTTWTIPS